MATAAHQIADSGDHSDRFGRAPSAGNRASRSRPVQYSDDTGRTNVTFSHGYIPELIADQRERTKLFDMRMYDSMIQYEHLREKLRVLHEAHGAELAALREQEVEGECCVCLDELGCAANVTKTACGHVYHTRCLIDTLADGSVRSCPMCRTDIKEIASTEVSGEAFKFMCAVRINADTVHSCTSMIKKEIERELNVLEEEARALQRWRVLGPLLRERRGALKAKLLHLRTRLQLLEQFSEANVEGFQDIFKHIGFELGQGLEKWCTASCEEKMGIFRDTGVSGEYMRIARRLSGIIQYIGIGKSDLQAHEEMLREQRGLASPSYSEAHFASCSAGCDGKDDADQKHIRGGCFVAFRRQQSVTA